MSTVLPPKGTSCVRCRTELHHDCAAAIVVDSEALCASCDDGVECPYMKTVRARGVVVKEATLAEVVADEPPTVEVRIPAPEPPKAVAAPKADGVNNGHKRQYKLAQREKALGMLNNGVPVNLAADACGLSRGMVSAMNTQRKRERIARMDAQLAAEVIDAVPLSAGIEARIEKAMKQEHERDIEALDRLRTMASSAVPTKEEEIVMQPETIVVHEQPDAENCLSRTPGQLDATPIRCECPHGHMGLHQGRDGSNFYAWSDSFAQPNGHEPKAEDITYSPRLARPTCTDDNYTAVIEDIELKIAVLAETRDTLITLRGTV